VTRSDERLSGHLLPNRVTRGKGHDLSFPLLSVLQSRALGSRCYRGTRADGPAGLKADLQGPTEGLPSPGEASAAFDA